MITEKQYADALKVIEEYDNQLIQASNHLRFDLTAAAMECNENRHAQVVMKELGITYQHATPQSLGDQWWFWNCENVPDNLPKYLTKLELNPMKCIGYGLSKEDAEKIRDYRRPQTGQ